MEHSGRPQSRRAAWGTSAIDVGTGAVVVLTFVDAIARSQSQSLREEPQSNLNLTSRRGSGDTRHAQTDVRIPVSIIFCHTSLSVCTRKVLSQYYSLCILILVWRVR